MGVTECIFVQDCGEIINYNKFYNEKWLNNKMLLFIINGKYV